MDEDFAEHEEAIIDAPIIKRWSYDYVVNNAFAAVVILIISLIIIVIFPRHSILFIIAIGVSIGMGFLMEHFLESGLIDLEFSKTEKILISGASAGLAGFTAGFFANRIMDVVPFIEQ